MGYIFKELNDDDIPSYIDIFKPFLLEDDFINEQEYRDYQSKKKSFTSWFLFDDEKETQGPVGWCALADLEYEDPSYMGLYGGVVLPEYRGKGLAKLMYRYRLDLYPTKKFMVHIQPQNIPSLNLAISMGFKPYKFDDPWIVLHR